MPLPDVMPPPAEEREEEQRDDENGHAALMQRVDHRSEETRQRHPGLALAGAPSGSRYEIAHRSSISLLTILKEHSNELFWSKIRQHLYEL